MQAAATLMPAFGAHAWSVRAMVVVLAVLSLPALVLAWVFEFTPKG